MKILFFSIFPTFSINLWLLVLLVVVKCNFHDGKWQTDKKHDNEIQNSNINEDEEKIVENGKYPEKIQTVENDCNLFERLRMTAVVDANQQIGIKNSTLIFPNKMVKCITAFPMDNADITSTVGAAAAAPAAAFLINVQHTETDLVNEENATTTTNSTVRITSKRDKPIDNSNDNLTGNRNIEVHFLDIPKGDDLKIMDLQLNGNVFDVASDLVQYLYPEQFPLETIRDGLKNNYPLYLWIFELLKMEIGLICWTLFWTLLVICFPLALICFLCFSSKVRHLNEDYTTTGSLNSENRNSVETNFGILLHALLIIILFPLILILAGNEQISRSINEAPVTIIYDDIETFIRNSHMQITFVATTSIDITIETIREDLEEINTLLGIPYQQELCLETGLNVALIALDELQDSLGKVTGTISDLLNDCKKANDAGNILQIELQEIYRQLIVMQQQCNVQDKPLCFTLQFSGIDSIIFGWNNITHNKKIEQLHHLNKEKHLNASIQMANKSFHSIPNQIAVEMAQYINDIKSILNKKRSAIYKSTHDLDILTKRLIEDLNGTHSTLSSVKTNAIKFDLWRWSTILGISAFVSLIWGIFLCGAPCGCGSNSKTVCLLFTGIILYCICCFMLWILGSVALFVGGHIHKFVCHPLHDQPHYKVLSELVNERGLFYGEEGIFATFKTFNSSLVVADVLKNCQRDQPAYKTFHLNNQFDIEILINYKNWFDLNKCFNDFMTAKANVEILSPALQLNLQVLSSLSTVNLTLHRQEIAIPLTKRDLASFAEQLNTVARHVNDPVNARKFDNAAFSIRKLIQNQMRKLNEIKDRILYEITTLEVLLPPLNRQVNQSLSHLKTIQFFLDNRAWQIAERTRKRFIHRIENYLDDLYNHTASKVAKEIGKCRPLWEMFHASRFSICKLIVNPLNGISLASFLLIILFILLTPVALKLIDYYKKGHADDDEEDQIFPSSLSHRRATSAVVIDNASIWTTPPLESPVEPRSPDSRELHTWYSPRTRRDSRRYSSPVRYD